MPEQTLIGSPSLYGGVSRQPPHQRHPSQVKSALNVGFSPVAGAYKRPGTKFVAYLGNARVKVTSVTGNFFVGDTVTQIGAVPATGTVVSVENVSGEANSRYLALQITSGTLELTTTLTGPSGSGALGYLQSYYAAGVEMRLHPILRDKREAYLMVLAGSQVPRFFPLTGQEAQVLYEGGVEATQKAYLASSSPAARDYRMLSVADTTFLANTLVLMAGNHTNGTIDATTMPRFIQRTALTPIAQFTILANVWPARTTGTGPATAAESPLPRMFFDNAGTRDPIPANNVGKKIADMAIHKGRFVIGAGPYVTFSAVNNYGMFFNNDSPIVASDPIEMSLPGSTITSVDRMMGYRDDMIVFGTPQAQFKITEISNTTAGFSPGNVQILPDAQFASLSLPLVPFRTGICFAAAQREIGCVYFFRYDDLAIQNTADELTVAVQGMLGPNIVRVAGDTNTGSLFVLTTDEPTVVYPFQQTMQGNKIVANAWFDRWEFPGLARICDIGTLNGVLYILGELAGGMGYVLEGMSIGTTLTSSDGTIAPTGGTSSITGEVAPITGETISYEVLPIA